MKAIDSSITIAIRTKSVDVITLYCLTRSVEYFKDIGDFDKCIYYARMGELYTRNYKHDFNSIAYYMRFLEWEVDALLILRRYEEAGKILSSNLHSFQVEECKKAKAWGFLSTLYEQFAQVLSYEQEYTKALFWYNQSIYYDEKSNNFLGCAITMENIGYIIYNLQLKDFHKAILYYNKALRYAERARKAAGTADLLNIRIESLNILDNIANSYFEIGDYGTAMTFFQRAFDQIRPGINEITLLQSSENDFLQNRSILYILSMIIDKGEVMLEWGKISGNIHKIRLAINIYKTADVLINRVRSSQTEIQSKLFWRKDSRRLYEHAIEASYILDNSREAFYFFEKSRAVLLSDQLNQLSKISKRDILDLARVKKQILQFDNELINTEHASLRYNDIQTELFKSKQESDRLEHLIKQKNPLYHQSFLDTSFIDLQEVQKKILNDHQALLEIFRGESSIYSLLITTKYVSISKFGKHEFDSTSEKYFSYISNQALLNSQFHNFIQTASHLYQLIFKNIDLPGGRIIVSPDGPIFPFEALVTNSNTISPAYFLNDHQVSYTYSARYLLTHFATDTSEGPGNFLGVAPVSYSVQDSLTDLKGSDLSLNRVGSYFTKKLNLIATDATRNNFQLQFSKYKIIQLYTHASESSSRGEPVIYFADSALYLSDLIPENKPQTRLIVLSACETGNGKFYQGEGVFSFNRGFASLGIPASITNLWSVDNKSTYQITELFYKYLSKGLPVDVALQKAKLEFIHTSSGEYRLPYYWAATILAGKTEAITGNKNDPWKDLAIISALAALYFLVWRKWRKK